ncbi:MAG: hypothetical protein DUD26_06045 [Eubacteriaceae bacterium]|jgi:hypothetical protein|uniref:Uncharacterized protein n=1 Tax=Candidatus Pseudoramibacter fermentans TaxID=2594427 RepID=A0A6L5GPR9_9FIRM|nr:hypothetical protein [Candidatus Pseudoramibacter fermentans]RRF92547.1 MAG: hypothetical protein DUD26_06045 [Eubacteriaceae bacterium]
MEHENKKHRVPGSFELPTWAVRLICAAAVVSVIFALYMMGRLHGFAVRNHYAGMANSGSEVTIKASKATKVKTPSVDSDHITYTSKAPAHVGCETIAALVLDHSEVDVNYSLRQHYYMKPVNGQYRYMTDSTTYSVPSHYAHYVSKKLAKAMGIKVKTVKQRYTWVMLPNHKGKTYDGERYGFNIYWVNRKITPDDVHKTFAAVRYNTKNKTYTKGTISARMVRQTDASIIPDTFVAK